MSNIIAKPFSWANKIVRAVFRGSPNLITTSDLNRQIEALKKEMFVLQQGLGVIISDFFATVQSGSTSTVRSTIYTNGSYVICGGVKFELSLVNTYQLDAGSDVQLRLYAKKNLVTYNDDFSKTISGAKFEDGTSQPAADHYVYSDPKVVLVNSTYPGTDLDYPDAEGEPGYEYICTLLRAFHSVGNPSTGGYYPQNVFVQQFTVNAGQNFTGLQLKYGKFMQFTLATKNNLDSITPGADDDWKFIAEKLWSRIYTLEKRLFMETTTGKTGIQTQVTVNGKAFATNRSFFREYTTHAAIFGTTELAYNFFIVGNICFAAGHVTFEKNTGGLSQTLTFNIGTGGNELPPSLYFTDTSCALTIQYNSAATAAKGHLDGSKLVFSGIPASGATLNWYVVYCFSSNSFWKYSRDDRYGFFNDFR